MVTALYSHPACAGHDTGPGHPERAARLDAVLAALGGDGFAALDRRPAPRGEIAAIERMHDAAYVEALFDAIPATGVTALDPDTALSPGTGEAVLRAVGAVVAAVDLVAGGTAANAFVATRPPGHHAEAGHGMGFCLFNNIAIAAAHARAVHGIARIAVVDFDVHHGNGTQAMFETDENYFYASSHQFPAYPGTGAADETGRGNIVNAPLAPGTGSAEFRHAMTTRILPALRDFAPEFLLISAGFDAHEADPLCQLNLQTEDFAWVTEELLAVAADCCAGRVVSTLEGGYDLDALADSAAAHVGVMMTG